MLAKPEIASLDGHSPSRRFGGSTEQMPSKKHTKKSMQIELGGQGPSTHVLSKQIEVRTSVLHRLRQTRRLAAGGRRRGDSARATGGDRGRGNS